jgi:hypothetical protein
MPENANLFYILERFAKDHSDVSKFLGDIRIDKNFVRFVLGILVGREGFEPSTSAVLIQARM